MVACRKWWGLGGTGHLGLPKGEGGVGAPREALALGGTGEEPIFKSCSWV